MAHPGQAAAEGSGFDARGRDRSPADGGRPGAEGLLGGARIAVARNEQRQQLNRVPSSPMADCLPDLLIFAPRFIPLYIISHPR